MIPVVGSKSTVQLLDPLLVEEESLAFLNWHPEGHSMLDCFADHIEQSLPSC